MQQLTDYLRDYTPRLDKYIHNYFDTQKQQAQTIDPFLTECLSYLENYLLGGKKIRGALTVLGYQINKTMDINNIIPVSAAIELIHSGLLIQDDFIDHDLMRRGIKSIHELYTDRKDPHFGASMAVVIGDLGYFYGYKIISDSDFAPVFVIKSLSELSQRLVNTGYGEILDVVSDNKLPLSRGTIDKARIYKTAHYSFVMPLSVGAILAGATDFQLQAIEKYGTQVGLAFQIQDDILGVTGDPKVTGKSNSSDITSGKQTHILQKTLELGDPQFIKKYYGTNKKTDEIRKLMQGCGAIDACKKLAQDHANQAKRYLGKITTNEKVKIILSQLADFVVTRNK